MGYSRIKQKMFNQIFNYFEENNYLFEITFMRQFWEKKYFDLKCDIGWSDWKELDNLMAKYDIRPTIHLVQMIQ